MVDQLKKISQEFISDRGVQIEEGTNSVEV